MDSLFVEETINTPSVKFEQDKGSMEIKGRSVPEDSLKFFKPLIKWVEDYKKDPRQQTTINIHLEYFNSSSAKNMFRILKEVSSISDAKNSVSINWYYDEDDEEMLHTAEDYQVMLKFPIKSICVK